MKWINKLQRESYQSNQCLGLTFPQSLQRKCNPNTSSSHVSFGTFRYPVCVRYYIVFLHCSSLVMLYYLPVIVYFVFFFLSTLALSGHLTAAVCITTTLLSLFFVFLLSLIFLFFLATFTDSLISLSPSSKPGAAFNQPLLGFTAVVTVIILSQDHFIVNLDVYSALSNFYTVTLLISIMNGKDLIISKHH